MVTKELDIRDNYVTELGYVGTLVKKLRFSRRHVGTISTGANFYTNKMPVEELSSFGQLYGTINPGIAITIRQEPAQEEGVIFSRTTLPKGIEAYVIVNPCATSSIYGSAKEQFEELLREQTREVEQFSVARPVVSPVEFESNPIVRVYPATGKHYPMRVVRRSVASFKLTPVRVFSKNIESTN